ncbi:oligosaccharide flippase family protein [Actinoplanes solisilvae]|uniref:oligosaccharide flippase family protein n=1 Tax=Actinoplanes solisilvae TaxID=2486853 RepID=UPI000FD6C066|nr:oligosaccharide flippase family protein [Actinoplanes solisilvae]
MTAVTTERANAPRRRMLLGLLANGGSRALLVATPAVTLPLITGSLGPVNYGAYAVITAIAAFLPWADFGVSLSMITTVSQAEGRGDRAAVRVVVSTGLVMLTAVSAVLLAVGLLLWAVVDWRTVLGLSDPSVTADVPLAVLVIFLAFVVGIPANLGLKVMLGLQMSRAFAFWQAASVPVVIGAVIAGQMLGAGLWWFVLATVGTPNLMALLASLWLFRRARPELRPRFALADRSRLRPMLALGAAFAVNSAAWAVSFSTTSIVVSHVHGADAAGVYNISERLSIVGFMVFESLLLPLWPMFGAGLAAGDFATARARLRTATLASAVIGVIVSVGFVLAAPGVIRVWLGEAYVPPLALLVALGTCSLIQFVAQPFTLVLSGAGAKRFLLISALALAVVTLPLSILLANATGIAGPAWALCLGIGGCVLVPSAWYALRVARPPATGAPRSG